jgi:hypothetical protein
LHLPQYPTIFDHFCTTETAISRSIQRTQKFHATTNLLILLINYSPFTNVSLFFIFLFFFSTVTRKTDRISLNTAPFATILPPF